MASRSASRNNILAGIFLLAGVALAVVISIILSGASEALHTSRRYTVLFSVAQGASGIKPGSSVLLGGQEIGKVRAVRFAPSGEQAGGTDVAVDIAVRAEFTLFTNAQVNLERPLLGSLSTINISDAGRAGVGGSTELAAGGTIRGSLAPPSFLAQAGVGNDEVMQIREIIKGASKSVSRVSAMLDRYEPQVDRIVADADAAVHSLRERVPAWSDDVDKVLAGARQVGPIADDVAAGVKDAREVVRRVGGVVDDGAPKVSAILTEAQSAAERINRESVGRLNAALDNAQTALEVVARVGNELSGLMREESPNIRRLLANARLASDQLKLAAIEIRSQPWRLLYTPTPKESETSVLYDAARNYAQAVSDLRAASESMEAAIGAGSTPGGAPGAAQASDHETLERMRTQLDEAFRAYGNAERALLERLIDRGGRSAIPDEKK